ncbi:MAG: hypothetical protein IT393_00245 [Nitrospirae bacterium]|nr:hypothetical protein [Nitrospirota bacterium]
MIDIAKYKKPPQCRRLTCFVYDPEGRLTNPRGIENDLSNCDSDIDAGWTAPLKLDKIC